MLNCVHYELPIDGFKIINKFRLEGIIIPSLVLKVLIVTKSSTFSGKDCVNFNADDSLPRYSEVRHSSVIVENNECVGIVAFDAIPPEDSLNLEKIATGIYISGGEVKRAPTKKGGKMVMVGWRTDFSRSGKMGNFGRYMHGSRDTVSKCAVSKEEIEVFGDYLTHKLTIIFRNLLPSYVQKLESFIQSGLHSILGTVGSTCLSTVGITLNYYSQPHLDEEDIGAAFITWFMKEIEDEPRNKSGGEFMLPEYGIFFVPKNGSVFGFETSDI